MPTKEKKAQRAAVRERDDGFFEVSGVAGYHHKADALRIAHQVGIAKARNEFRPNGPEFDADDVSDEETSDDVSDENDASR